MNKKPFELKKSIDRQLTVTMKGQNGEPLNHTETLESKQNAEVNMRAVINAVVDLLIAQEVIILTGKELDIKKAYKDETKGGKK